MNLRRIARTLKITHPTVAHWVSAHAAELPDVPPQPATASAVNELDEFFTFVASKKGDIRPISAVRLVAFAADGASSMILIGATGSILETTALDVFATVQELSPSLTASAVWERGPSAGW